MKLDRVQGSLEGTVLEQDEENQMIQVHLDSHLVRTGRREVVAPEKGRGVSWSWFSGKVEAAGGCSGKGAEGTLAWQTAPSCLIKETFKLHSA